MAGLLAGLLLALPVAGEAQPPEAADAGVAAEQEQARLAEPEVEAVSAYRAVAGKYRQARMFPHGQIPALRPVWTTDEKLWVAAGNVLFCFDCPPITEG